MLVPPLGANVKKSVHFLEYCLCNGWDRECAKDLQLLAFDDWDRKLNHDLQSTWSESLLLENEKIKKQMFVSLFYRFPIFRELWELCCKKSYMGWKLADKSPSKDLVIVFFNNVRPNGIVQWLTFRLQRTINYPLMAR